MKSPKTVLINSISFALLAVGVVNAAQAAEHRTMVATRAPLPAAAEAQGCIALKTVAEIEEQYVKENGERAVRLVPASRVVPGTEVVWTVSASNVCARVAENVFIDNPVPEHMSYLANSATGIGADVVYSLDGKRFALPEQLTVKESDGSVRAARSDEYSHIRWTFKNPIASGQLAIARFRAAVK